MKRLVLVTVLIIAACNMVPSVTPTTTPTPLVIPAVTETHEPTPTPVVIIPTAVPTTEKIPEGTYLIQQGDTLSGIALRSGVLLEYLAKENGIVNLDDIYAGSTLIIPKWPPDPPVPDTTSVKEIIVVLSTQMACASEYGVIVNCVLVSTGVPRYPTPPGHYNIYLKTPFLDMSGPGYHYEDVPWDLCFLPKNDGYCIHGTWWHNNFGYVMSHGCVNMTIPDAEWFYNWADDRTIVWVKE